MTGIPRSDRAERQEQRHRFILYSLSSLIRILYGFAIHTESP